MGGHVTKIQLRYLHGYEDCRGRMRYYVRRKGKPRVALPGFPGSNAFMAAYNAAIGDLEMPARPDGRCLSALFESYFNSAAFQNRADGTKITYRKAIKPIDLEHGHRKVADLPHDRARRLIEDIGAQHPGMANVTRAALRKAFDHAIKLKWRADNPFIGIERYTLGSHHTWTDEQLAKFMARWPLGTRERMLFDLLYYTAQRVSDVAKMKRSDVGPNGIYIKQQKTGVELHIPLHPALRRSMNAYGIRGQYLVAARDGKKMTPNSLSQVLTQAANKAALPAECVTHGIRKAVLRQLSERNMGSRVIASMSGHKTLREIERYTEKADQGRMVVQAIAAIPDTSG